MRSFRALSALVACWQLSSAAGAHAQTLWSEGAEHGPTYVIDGTSASYPLIQSDVVGSGSYAFHLTNPEFQDNWFVLDRDIPVASDTRLFFLSQLSWATPTQVARVQVSTDGGATWPVQVYSQSGDGTAGEGAFAMREVDLSGYADEEIRLRFLYDFTGGAAFTNTETAVGWRVDDIQVGPALQKTIYSIGDPSAEEQLYLEYINRARADALAEAQRLAAETDPHVASALTQRGINPQDIVDQFTQSVLAGCLDATAQPLSFNRKLQLAAELHSEDMWRNQFQGHDNSANPPPPLTPGGGLASRLQAVGYVGGAAENVFAYAESAAHGHAAFNVDWGDLVDPTIACYDPAFTGQGMQNGAGHRATIHSDAYKEIGIGVIEDAEGPLGPQIVTQDFGNPGNVALVTGVVFEDLNGNQFYDPGEGRGGVRVDIQESPFYAITSTSGAYTIPVSQDGSYTVEFHSGVFEVHARTVEVAAMRNVKLDYVITGGPLLAGDYDRSGTVDEGDYQVWKQAFGSTSDLLADGNGDRLVNLADYALWRDALREAGVPLTSGSVVPEPHAWLLCVACMGIAWGRAAVLRRF